MSKWATPPELPSDGCSWWSILNDFLGRDRNKKYCRRHDFECRYGLYKWNDARDYMLKGMSREPVWTWFRIPFVWIGLTIWKKSCDDYAEPLPPEWAAWVNRDYEP